MRSHRHIHRFHSQEYNQFRIESRQMYTDGHQHALARKLVTLEVLENKVRCIDITDKCHDFHRLGLA